MVCIPDNATLCRCWVDATLEQREKEYENRNHATFSPRGLRACDKCGGEGWYLSPRSRT